MAELAESNVGFTWGPAKIERWISDDKRGWVVLGVTTKKYPHGMQVYVTKTGKVRVSAKGSEWKPMTEILREAHEPRPAAIRKPKRKKK